MWDLEGEDGTAMQSNDGTGSRAMHAIGSTCSAQAVQHVSSRADRASIPLPPCLCLQLMLFSGGDDAEVRVWDLVEKTCTATLKVRKCWECGWRAAYYPCTTIYFNDLCCSS